MARRFIYCVPLMLVDLSKWKIVVARRFIYCVPLMEDSEWLVDLSIVCP